MQLMFWYKVESVMRVCFLGRYITFPIDLAYMLFHVGLIFHVLKTSGIV